MSDEPVPAVYKPTTIEMEVAVAQWFGIRRNMIVPNISWGMGIHECDMLIVSRTGFATEIEIKISKADLKKDASKRHGHISQRIRKLFFAIPDHLESAIDLVPERAGVIVVGHGRYCRLRRPAKINREVKPFSDSELLHMGRLGSMRIWSLKERIIDHRQVQKELLEEVERLRKRNAEIVS